MNESQSIDTMLNSLNDQFTTTTNYMTCKTVGKYKGAVKRNCICCCPDVGLNRKILQSIYYKCVWRIKQTASKIKGTCIDDDSKNIKL